MTADRADLDQARQALRIAELSGDDFGLNLGADVRGGRPHHGDTGQSPGSVEAEVMQIREDVRTQRYANPIWMPRFDQISGDVCAMRSGDYDAATELIGSIIGDDLAGGHHRSQPVRGPPFWWRSTAARAPGDLEEAEAAVE